MKSFARTFALCTFVVAALAACSQPVPPAEDGRLQLGADATPASTPVEIKAPAGQYQIDPAHSSLGFSVNHLGLSNYLARFTQYTVAVELDPANLAASSVTATIDPASIRTDHSGDYRGTHKDSPYKSWDEDLAQSPKFFNTAAHPQITFKSTGVEKTVSGLRIAGNLAMLGQTHPITLDAVVVGSAAAHPFTQLGAMGFSAVGTFDRSAFGMTHLLQPLLVGDRVTIHFEGEFQQVVAPEAKPAG